MSGFWTLASQHAYRGLASSRVDTVESCVDGRTSTRHVVEHGAAVAIGAIGAVDATGSVALLEQSRQPLEDSRPGSDR